MTENEELKMLLEENILVAKDNNRLLRLIRRDSMIGLIVKIVIWLVLLGVPLFFLSTYLGPLLDSFSNGTATGASGVPFMAPSKEEIELLKEAYGL